MGLFDFFIGLLEIIPVIFFVILSMAHDSEDVSSMGRIVCERTCINELRYIKTEASKCLSMEA
jgi:Na+/H+-dicarboxylate symporter